MKKTLLGLAVASLFAVGTAQAATDANDTAATLSISGTVTAYNVSCAVHLSQSAVTLDGDVDTMINQGENSTAKATVNVTVTGGETCDEMAGQGRIAYKFIGSADAADGTVLASSAAGANAATGVGIGIYNLDNTPLKVNNDTLMAIPGSLGSTFGLQLVKLTGADVHTGDVAGSLTVQIERL